MLIDSFAPNPDAIEKHKVEIRATPGEVYQALWTADLCGSVLIKGLMSLRSLPGYLLHPPQPKRRVRKITMESLIEAGFGLLAEEPGKEIVLGIVGRFWRPTGNVQPFKADDFRGPVAPGIARAVWNFSLEQRGAGNTILRTETRVVCGDAGSKSKFRAYWLFVRPFSGLIRRVMLRAVKRACEL